MNSKMFNINTMLRDGVERDVDRKGESIMEMSEKLIELHSKGYNCGQIICAVLGEELGWDQSTPEALADMCESCGQICGTLRGGDFLHQQIHEIPFERESGSIKDAVKSYWSKRSSSFSEHKQQLQS